MKLERVSIREMYQFYKKECGVVNSPAWFVDYKSFTGIINDFNKEIARIIIEKGAEFTMPLRLGSLRIKKYKQKTMNPDGTIIRNNMVVDWKRTKELWKELYPGKSLKELKPIRGKQVVYYLNEHTDGYRYKFYWNRRGSNARNRGIYSIIFTFTNNRHLASVLKSDTKPEYYE